MVAKFVLAWNFSRQFRVAEFYAKAANHLGRPGTSRERSPSSTVTPRDHDPDSTDDLCDGLLAHMLQCDDCLHPERKCSVYEGLAAQIKNQGGASKPAVYAV